MNTYKYILIILTLSLSAYSALAEATPGRYAGTTEDLYTTAAFKLNRRNRIVGLRVITLTSACTTHIPDQEPVDYERDTNITRFETPIVVVNLNGRFSEEFHLIDPERVDFQGATVTLNGRVRGNRARLEIHLTYTENHEDNSTVTCAGSALVKMRYFPRRPVS